ncbi:MAG TPA: DUF2934 domain-containing protein [Thermodesulfobacteriota bacterium]|jgi:hypothetical protein|nr:DUF2934 domain-containing protein [Thermodesulfobacteriota bacterium]
MARVTKTKNPKEKPKVDPKTLHEMIEKKAYEIYEKRGREHGRDLDDWLEAERIVMGKRKKK